MKKLLAGAITGIMLSGLAVAPALAADYPYSPTEALEKFEEFHAPHYDQINIDLQAARKLAKEWAADSELYSFEINWADGTEPGYVFTFMSFENLKDELQVFPGLDGTLQSAKFPRRAGMRYGIFNVGHRLRNLVPTLKANNTVLPLLERRIDDYRNVGIRFTLKKNIYDRLTWYINFDASHNPDEAWNIQSYQVRVTAETDRDLYFGIVHTT